MVAHPGVVTIGCCLPRKSGKCSTLFHNLDLPNHAKTLFPEDSFGTRTKGDTGKPIELRYGGHAEQTDIRIKSEQTISPRKRFTAWFQKELSATPGDRIRVTRTADRAYELTHLPK